MANTVSAVYTSAIVATETIDDGSLSNSGNAVVHSAFNKSATLNSGSTPPATVVVAFNQALTGGAATIDLTALTGLNGATISAAGLKLQAIQAKATAGNSGVITLTAGASNGYKLASVSAWKIGLSPGGCMTWVNGADTGDDVANGSTDEIDLAGTGTDSVDLELIFG